MSFLAGVIMVIAAAAVALGVAEMVTAPDSYASADAEPVLTDFLL